MATLQQDLEDEVVNHPGRVLLIVGAGVSIASSNRSPVASWLGFLKNGVDYCAGHCAGLPDGWADRMRDQLGRGDLVELISVAEDVSTRLGFPDGGEFTRWLSETVGALQPDSPQLIQALAAWNVQFATTNYDDLIEKTTQKQPITWLDRSQAIQFFRGEVPDVLHLHGYWRKPASVILEIRPYDRIVNDEATQSILRGLLMGRTVVFVGFGAGMEDPNFSSLLIWSQRVLSISMHRHYRLASRSEVTDFNRQHPEGSRISTVEYGAGHNDLLPFVEAIAARVAQRQAPPVIPLVRLLGAQGDFDRQRADLNERKPSMLLGDFFHELLKIARGLWHMGGRRTACMMIAGTFDRESAGLTADERLRCGLDLAEMMLDDDLPDSAARVLQRLVKDVQQDAVPSALAAQFWQLQVRCFSGLCAYSQALHAIQEALASRIDEQSRLRLVAERAEILLLQGDDDPAMNH